MDASCAILFPAPPGDRPLILILSIDKKFGAGESTWQAIIENQVSARSYFSVGAAVAQGAAMETPGEGR